MKLTIATLTISLGMVSQQALAIPDDGNRGAKSSVARDSQGRAVDTSGSDFGQFGRAQQNAGQTQTVTSSSNPSYGASGSRSTGTASSGSGSSGSAQSSGSGTVGSSNNVSNDDRCGGCSNEDHDNNNNFNPYAGVGPNFKGVGSAHYNRSVWDPYKNYTVGEFGNIGDYTLHETSIQKAIAEANRVSDNCKSCSSSEKSSLRTAARNNEYYESLNKADPTNANKDIAKGPMEASLRYNHGLTPAQIKGNQPVSDTQQAMIDQAKHWDNLVKTGDASVYMPGDLPLETNTDVQELGRLTSVTFSLNSNSFRNNVPGLEYLPDMAWQYGATHYGVSYSVEGVPDIYPGGIIAMASPLRTGNISYLDTVGAQGDLLRHEMSHAGELAIVNQTNKMIDSGRTLSGTLARGAAAAEDVRINGKHVEGFESPRAARIAGEGQNGRYPGYYTEIAAYMTDILINENTPKIGSTNVQPQIYKIVSKEYDMPLEEAQEIVDEVWNSPTFRETYEAINNAARELLK